MVLRRKGSTRREFLEASAAVGVTAATMAAASSPGEAKGEITAGPPLESNVARTNLQAQCPYCGVGCGTLIQVENGRIVGMVPDKEHPTNKGLQCIKGLTSAEAIYVDRLEKPLIRKDMSDPMRGKVSKTKGSFDPEMFEEASWEHADELVTDKIVEIAKQDGNAVGLYGSGQLTLEGQWLENVLMKGIIGSNTIEANARMCMTSAVTGYFKTLGSDTPPTCYDDIEMSDFVTFWGHNPRGAHPILFWRVADHKKKKGIPTLVVDPRRTGTVQALEDINPKDSHHFSTINGDISIHNALAYVILTKHPEAVDWDLRRATARSSVATAP